MFLNSILKPVLPLYQQSIDSSIDLPGNAIVKTVKSSSTSSFGMNKAMNACWNTFSSCVTAIDERAAKVLKKIPVEKRAGRSLQLLTGLVTAIPLTYAYSQNAVSGFFALTCLNTVVYVVNNRAHNCRARDIRQVIEYSQLENENKEGVALILNASKWADYNNAFGDDELHLKEIEMIAKRFLIEYQTISTPQQLSETIEDVCKKSDKPVKLVIIRGHGALKEIQLSLSTSVKSDDKKLIEALKKTDESAHIILQSCSTGKLRSADGISFADQLSLDLPGRTVSGASTDAAVALMEHNDYPQGITLACLQVAVLRTPQKQIVTHSFCVKENKRFIKTLLPPGESLKKYQPAIYLDAQYKTESLINKHKYHYNFSFKDLQKTVLEQLNANTAVNQPSHESV